MAAGLPVTQVRLVVEDTLDGPDSWLAAGAPVPSPGNARRPRSCAGDPVYADQACAAGPCGGPDRRAARHRGGPVWPAPATDGGRYRGQRVLSSTAGRSPDRADRHVRRAAVAPGTSARAGVRLGARRAGRYDHPPGRYHLRSARAAVGLAGEAEPGEQGVHRAGLWAERHVLRGRPGSWPPAEMQLGSEKIDNSRSAAYGGAAWGGVTYCQG
ncbi:hypothetical protein HBB16_08125 [Pseudonocardia sp. MCCB 268]|nr:hypothetical protein [Pseudonocardia cytotoxica]